MVSLLRKCVFVCVKRNSYVQVSGVPATQIKVKAPPLPLLPLLSQRGPTDSVFQQVLPRPLYFSKWKVSKSRKAKHQAQELFKDVKSPSRRGAKRLLLDMFTPLGTAATQKATTSKKKYARPNLKPWMHPLVGAVQKLIRNHLRCKYAGLLAATTKLSTKHTEQDNEKDALLGALGQYTPNHEVVRFLWCAFRKVIPKELFGSSSHNRDVLKSALKKYVGLKRKERMCTAQLTQGLRVSAIPWLVRHADERQAMGPGQRKIALGKLVYWLFSNFFCPLVKSFFYCTDTSPDHSRVYYYKHHLWKRVKELSVDRLLGSSLIEPVRDKRACADKQYSHLRVLPKATGIRPILSMSRSSSVHAKLKGSFAVLSFEKVIQPNCAIHSTENTSLLLLLYTEQKHRRLIQEHTLFSE